MGEQIAGDQADCGKHRRGDNDVDVASEDGFNDERTEAGPTENHLDEQRNAKERADRKPKERNQRIERHGESVAVEQSKFRNSVTLGSDQKWRVQNANHRRTNVTSENR